MTLTNSYLENFESKLNSRKMPATIDSYIRDVRGFIDYLSKMGIELHQVTQATITEYRDYLHFDSGDKANSVRRKIIGIKVFSTL